MNFERNKPLIQAALDGKVIQYRNPHRGLTNWHDADARTAIQLMIHTGYLDNEYRIRPEPVPDKVAFGWVSQESNVAEDYMRKLKEKNPTLYLVKVTIKTDENGVETKHVEIVE